jgi:hypothetical protein
MVLLNQQLAAQQQRWKVVATAGTHNKYQLHEEADEAHHNETNSGLRADLVELCTRRGTARA